METVRNGEIDVTKRQYSARYIPQPPRWWAEGRGTLFK